MGHKARSPEDVRREIESERKRLARAVGTLRTEADGVRRRLPVIALGAVGAVLALRATARLLRRRG